MNNKIEISKLKLIWGLIFILAAGILLGIAYGSNKIKDGSKNVPESFKQKSVSEERDEILKDVILAAKDGRLEFAISKAEEEGAYKCCIEPACVTCFLEEGECDCRERLANGENPCDECRKGLSEGRSR